MKRIFACLPLLCACNSFTPAAEAPSHAPARSIFDGKTLSGWMTEGGRYDGHALWSVEEGAITGREGANAAGGLIYTEDSYQDFELELEAWIPYPFDSGIFLHMVPPDLKPQDGGGKGPQITLDYRPQGEVGGVYADGFLYHNSQGSEDWKRGQWNHLRVRCVGVPQHIAFWLNGQLQTDYHVPVSEGSFAPTGHIGLQVHGARNEPEESVVRFKNIRVTELEAGADDFWAADEAGTLSLTAAGQQAGWRSLFNGVDLTGWRGQGDGSGYAVEDGTIAFLVEGQSDYLMTAEDYQDFDLRLDFKIASMANSGLFLRSAHTEDNPSYSGCEVQILDDFNWERVTQTTLKPYQFSGGLYGSVAPKVKDALRPIGEWNTYQVHFHGNRIQTQLNGQLLYDVNTLEVPGKPFAERVPKGFIGMQRHAPAEVEGRAYVWFRNLYVRPAEH